MAAAATADGGQLGGARQHQRDLPAVEQSVGAAKMLITHSDHPLDALTSAYRDGHVMDTSQKLPGLAVRLGGGGSGEGAVVRWRIRALVLRLVRENPQWGYTGGFPVSCWSWA